MPAVVTLKTQDVDSPQKRAQFKVCVLGCGLKGVFYSLAFAEAGFQVVCTDADQSVIKRISKASVPLRDRQLETKLKAYLRKEQITATSDVPTAVSASDIIIITLSPKVDDKKIAQTSEVLAACKQVGTALKRGSLIVYCGVAGIGFTESFVKETVENTSGLKAGESFGLAYHPNLTGLTTLKEKENVVAANDKYSLNAVAAIFECVSPAVTKVLGIKLAEAAMIFAAAKRDTIKALGNELAVLCENANIDYVEALHLLKEGGAAEPGLLGEMNREETYLLLENAESLNVKLRLPPLVRQINEEMVKHAFSVTQNALRTGGITLRRTKLALLGATESEGIAAFAQLLESKGVKVTRYSPYLGDEDCGTNSGNTQRKKTINEAVEGANGVIVFSPQDQLGRLNLKKLRALMKSPAIWIDLACIVEPQKVEAAGFLYRGLGRGVYQK